MRCCRPKNLAREIEEENDAERLACAVSEMDDEERARDARLRREEADLSKVLEESRERVGVAPDDLRHVVGAALSRVGFDLDQAEGDAVGRVKTYHFDPKAPAFAKDGGWDDAFDDLRVRPRKRGERLGEAKTLDQLDRALREARSASPRAVARVQVTTERDLADLVPALEEIAGKKLAEAV